MRQIRQNLGDGKLDMSEVPLPSVGPGDVLVRTHFSFVSVGTEKMKVTQARMNLAEKAAERPDQVRQVLTTLREQGLMPTVRKVQERLKSPATLGYACAGVVAAVGGAHAEARARARAGGDARAHVRSVQRRARRAGRDGYVRRGRAGAAGGATVHSRTACCDHGHAVPVRAGVIP